MKQLITQLKQLIDSEHDKLRLYSLCSKDHKRIIVDSKGELSKNADYHMI